MKGFKNSRRFDKISVSSSRPIHLISFYPDALGRLKVIQPLEQALVHGQTLENKREFILENIQFASKIDMLCFFFFNAFLTMLSQSLSKG
jgi:hypothetical protein